jgi:hypothetical protein
MVSPAMAGRGHTAPSFSFFMIFCELAAVALYFLLISYCQGTVAGNNSCIFSCRHAGRTGVQ